MTNPCAPNGGKITAAINARLGQVLLTVAIAGLVGAMAEFISMGNRLTRLEQVFLDHSASATEAVKGMAHEIDNLDQDVRDLDRRVGRLEITVFEAPVRRPDLSGGK